MSTMLALIVHADALHVECMYIFPCTCFNTHTYLHVQPPCETDVC